MQAGQTYLALPGCRGNLQLGSVTLTLADDRTGDQLRLLALEARARCMTRDDVR